jgi:hypothetical protein
MHGNNLVALFGELPINIDEVSDRRLRGARQDSAIHQAVKELVASNFYAVLVCFFPEKDRQRNNDYLQVVDNFLGKVGCAIGNDSNCDEVLLLY